VASPYDDGWLLDTASDLEAEIDRLRRVVYAACAWRSGLVEVGARLLDADDGNAEPEMKRPAAVRVLVDAIDAYRKESGNG
jgi:hypothetical protein